MPLAGCWSSCNVYYCSSFGRRVSVWLFPFVTHVIFRVRHLYVYLFLPTVWRFHFIKWSSSPEAVEISRVGLDMVGIRCLYMTIRLWNLTCSGFLIEPFYLFIYYYYLLGGLIKSWQCPGFICLMFCVLIILSCYFIVQYKIIIEMSWSFG
jgi:hypothetical protein